MKKFGLVLCLISFGAFAIGDAAKGAKIWKKVNCTLCHKKDGSGKVKDVSKIKILKGPKIAGLSAEYAYAQLVDIQSKKRKTKNTMMMYSKIKKLSDQDLKDVATYAASLSKTKHKGMLEK